MSATLVTEAAENVQSVSKVYQRLVALSHCTLYFQPECDGAEKGELREFLLSRPKGGLENMCKIFIDRRRVLRYYDYEEICKGKVGI